MNLESLGALARQGRLYPSIIVHGATEAERRGAAERLARILLCESEASSRPCGVCKHCARIFASPRPDEAFHPDFQVLERDLRASTSVAATKAFLGKAQVTPFEARGQVFVITNAETLSGGAANALLKTLEEPHVSAPRNFILLAPSQFDLLPTIRSRSLPVYLGDAGQPDEKQVATLAEGFDRGLGAFEASGSVTHLLVAAGLLAGGGSWDDPRASGPWEVAAAAVRRCARSEERPPAIRRKLLSLAEALLTAPTMRLRSVPAKRIIEGLVVGELEPKSGP